MSYCIYQTEAFVMGARNLGESSRTVTLFTKEFGLLHAHAQGIRELRSKLQPRLQVFSHGTFCLVRGREVWRVTNAESGDVPPCVRADRRIRTLVARLYALANRLIGSEEKNPQLFEDIKQVIDFLHRQPLSDDELGMVEIISVLKILYHLGYLNVPKTAPELLWFARMPHLEKSAFSDMDNVKEHAVSTINDSIRASQL